MNYNIARMVIIAIILIIPSWSFIWTTDLNGDDFTVEDSVVFSVVVAVVLFFIAIVIEVGLTAIIGEG